VLYKIPLKVVSGLEMSTISDDAVSEFKMAGSAEFVDLAETEGASRKPTKTIEFSHRSLSFFFNIIGFLGVFMEFLEVKPEIFRTFLENSRKDF